MRTTRMKVPPALAQEWLQFNTHNRNHRPAVVSAYATAMAAGDWHTDVDPICFAGKLDGKGKYKPVLLNGQHRLMGQVVADITLEYLVIEGLAVGDQADMDAGVRRQLGDQLRLMGIQYPSETAAVIRLVYAYENDMLRRVRSGLTHATMLRFLNEHPELPDSVLPGKRLYDAIGGRLSVYGSAHYILSGIDEAGIDEDVDEFFARLQHGDGLAPGAAILLYRNQILGATSARTTRRRMEQVNQLALLFKTWNAFRAGVQLSNLSWRAGGRNPEPFPNPE
jgi:hypothetical protein